jgi:hypothetical protein
MGSVRIHNHILLLFSKFQPEFEFRNHSSTTAKPHIFDKGRSLFSTSSRRRMSTAAVVFPPKEIWQSAKQNPSFLISKSVASSALVLVALIEFLHFFLSRETYLMHHQVILCLVSIFLMVC